MNLYTLDEIQLKCNNNLQYTFFDMDCSSLHSQKWLSDSDIFGGSGSFSNS